MYLLEFLDNYHIHGLDMNRKSIPYSKILGLFVFIYILFSGPLTNNKMNYGLLNFSSKTTKSIYGPISRVSVLKETHYKFISNDVTDKTYGGILMERLTEVNKFLFQRKILSALPPKTKNRAKKYLDYTLKMAEKYNIDPFWILSIMWTESHFRISARSYVNASGLMQVMPGTAYYIMHLMGKRPKSIKDSAKRSKDPKVNIELGIFYLKYLLKKFDGNYTYATVAYNMGPAFVSRRLRRNMPVGTRNLYLTKVVNAYDSLSLGVKHKLEIKKRPYQNTYVVQEMNHINNVIPEVVGGYSEDWNTAVQPYSLVL